MDRGETAAAVLAALDECGDLECTGWHRARWTQETLTALCKHGREHQFTPWANSRVAQQYRNGGEWLYDCCWLDYQDDVLLAIPMAAECEWGSIDEIRDDFQKLLVSNAQVRVMICAAWCIDDDHQGQATAQQICDWVRDFTGTRDGDCYVLAAYQRQDNRFRSYRYTITADGHGKPPVCHRVNMGRLDSSTSG
ncbi:MAG: hypothetical protein F4109_04230 [Gammaproteobacteria bacterium]|nr:hypothetical protein [Gammaproteobacteria bacterium]